MNLAEIRRKAQAAEAQNAEARAVEMLAAAAPAPTAAAPSQPVPAAAEPALAPGPAMAAPAAPAPAASAPAAAAATGLPQWDAIPEWQPPEPFFPEDPVAELEPEVLTYPGLSFPDQPQPNVSQPAWAVPEEASGFDPAAVILKGRLSASGEEDDLAGEQPAEADLELLCFRVATEDYAISIMDIKEIIKPRDVTEVPRVPDFVRGILSLRGIIIPVFDMRLRLGLPEGVRSERERIIVVKRLDGFCGVLVDQVVQVVRIAEAAVEAPPVVLEGIDREFVQGIGRVAGKMLILLDMEKVLDVGLL